MLKEVCSKQGAGEGSMKQSASSRVISFSFLSMISPYAHTHTDTHTHRHTHWRVPAEQGSLSLAVGQVSVLRQLSLLHLELLGADHGGVDGSVPRSMELAQVDL